MDVDRLTRSGPAPGWARGDAVRQWSVTILQMILDITVVILCFNLSYNIRRVLPEIIPFLTPLAHDFSLYTEVWPALLLWPLLLWREDLYPGFSHVGGDHLRRIAAATSVAGLLVMAATFLTKTGPQFSRPIIAGGWMFTMIAVPLERLALRRLLNALGVTGPRAIVLGAGETARAILKGLRSQRPPSLRPVAAFDDDPAKIGGQISSIPIVGPIREAAEYLNENGIQVAIVAMPGAGRERLIQVIEEQAQQMQRIIVVPDLLGLSTADTDSRDIGGNLALEVRKNLLYPLNRIAKRLLDYGILLLLAPFVITLVVLISGLIWLEGGRPVLFTHERIGLDGRPFLAWKFRTMVTNADEVLRRHLRQNQDLREEWEQFQKLKDDPRLTRVGKLLRRLSLDELPQLWNVVLGDMSLVGPRPIIQEEIPRYGRRFALYKQVRPGLTGLWQVSGRSELNYETRVELDAYYVRNWTVWLDFVILARTGWAVLSGRGAY